MNSGQYSRRDFLRRTLASSAIPLGFQGAVTVVTQSADNIPKSFDLSQNFPKPLQSRNNYSIFHPLGEPGETRNLQRYRAASCDLGRW